MTKRAKITWGVVAVFGLLAIAVVGLEFLDYESLMQKIRPIAMAYKPDCSSDDPSCRFWTAFRQIHPYPYQTIAVRQLPDATRMVILSEPAPMMPLSDLIGSKRFKWYIGTDGWVEDLVLKVRAGSGTAPLDDPLLRDRIAVLHRALFGTNFGGEIEMLDGAPTVPPGHLSPNLRVSPREVSSWLSDNSRLWHAVDGEDDEVFSWDSIREQSFVGAFASGDNTLIMLTFPTRLLAAARANNNALDSLRKPFREFAVASDDVIGGVWGNDGQTAILARVRTRPLEQLPPLRFETFNLLAKQSADELSQSYERNTIFAGKLQSGEYELKDWAPIYLSPSLIDTELGALLNITDQMLKSWSQAGAVEYLYFTYPKPKDFPFTMPKGTRPAALSDVLKKVYGADSVLFNWNTAGSGVAVKPAEFSTLTTKQTGALPVTYGADGSSTKSGAKSSTDDLFDYEEKAYKYFADMGDPNLGRVVQYTLLYQLFRAIAKDDSASSHNPYPPGDAPAVISPLRAKAISFLVEETTSLLNDFDAGRLPKLSKDFTEQLSSRLRAFRTSHPDYDNARLGAVLVNRFSPDASALLNAYIEAREHIDAERETLNSEIDRYNLMVRMGGTGLKAQEDDLDRRKAALKAAEEDFDKQDVDPVDKIRTLVYEVAGSVRDLDQIRKTYIELNKAEPQGSIKTPSVVLSWNTQEGLVNTGGHNVDSFVLRMEKIPSVTGISLVTDSHGKVVRLRYNPSEADGVEAHASELARAIEHRGVRDPAELAKLIEEPSTIRPPKEALGLNASANDPPRKEFGRLGKRVFAEKSDFVLGLRTLAETNSCCIYVARDAEQTAFVAEPNLHAPPPILTFEIRDTPSLVEHLALFSKRTGTQNERAVIFLDEPASHVKALTLGLSEGLHDPQATTIMAAALGESLSEEGPNTVSAIAQHDLEGRSSVMRTLRETIVGPGRDLLKRLGVIEPRDHWASASVAEVQKAELDAMIANAGWEDSRDGLPSAIKVSFGGGGNGNVPPDVSVVAGFGPEDAGKGKLSLMASHKEAIARIPPEGASTAQYLMTVRNNLQKLPPEQIRRILLVAHDEAEKKILFTLLQKTVGNGGA